ncbi:hypothetical protein D7Y15_11780 [Corallococcus sp. AB030]|nr:hypothetical protein D7V77_05745 [Corallococcus sp. CA041A]RKI16626.1 hypothetical protein D7Y15_11780 [Corallococcus sp. AB030]RUO92953.1 hypothetical protein D7Y11_12230 [Corallococcus sp. AB018]
MTATSTAPATMPRFECFLFLPGPDTRASWRGLAAIGAPPERGGSTLRLPRPGVRVQLTGRS